MRLDYIAFFADENLLNRVKSLNWQDALEVAAFFHHLESDSLLKVWGSSTDAFPLNAITEWLKNRCGLVEFGCELGRKLLITCDYINFVLDAKQQAKVLNRIKDVNPVTDDLFDASVEEYLSDLGLEYVDLYLADGMDEFYRIFEEMRNDMKDNLEKTLIVMIPA